MESTRKRLDTQALSVFSIFTVGSPFVMRWQLLMTILLLFCAVFIPYDAGFVVPTCVPHPPQPH